jgi:hypothetical protein
MIALKVSFKVLFKLARKQRLFDFAFSVEAGALDQVMRQGYRTRESGVLGVDSNESYGFEKIKIYKSEIVPEG